MRNIKFRGKSNREWVYGLLLKSDKNDKYKYLIQSENERCKCCGKELVKYFITDGETIGQYTGLKDENGKEIYEGDIVLIDAYTYTEPEFSEEYLVEYNELLGMWELKNLEDNKDIKTFEDLNGWYKLDIELLGNKWDNPELLEKGEQ